MLDANGLGGRVRGDALDWTAPLIAAFASAPWDLELGADVVHWDGLFVDRRAASHDRRAHRRLGCRAARAPRPPPRRRAVVWAAAARLRRHPRRLAAAAEQGVPLASAASVLDCVEEEEEEDSETTTLYVPRRWPRDEL